MPTQYGAPTHQHPYGQPQYPGQGYGHPGMQQQRNWNAPPPGQGYTTHSIGSDWYSFAIDAFFKVDKDHSGSIDINEFPELVHMVYNHFHKPPPSQNECRFLMLAFDANGDGKLSANEFIDMMKALTGGR